MCSGGDIAQVTLSSVFRNNSSRYTSILPEGRGVVANFGAKMLVEEGKANPWGKVHPAQHGTWALSVCLSRPLPQPPPHSTWYSGISLPRGPRLRTALSSLCASVVWFAHDALPVFLT